MDHTRPDRATQYLAGSALERENKGRGVTPARGAATTYQYKL